jgi:hypothetical protein
VNDESRRIWKEETQQQASPFRPTVEIFTLSKTKPGTFKFWVVHFITQVKMFNEIKI